MKDVNALLEQVLRGTHVSLGLSDSGHLPFETTALTELQRITTDGATPDEMLAVRVLLGGGTLPSSELLTILVGPRTAETLCARFHSLGAVLAQAATAGGRTVLAAECGVGLADLARLYACGLIAIAVTREQVEERPIIDHWDKLIAYLRTCLAHRTVEEFRVLYFNRGGVLITDEVQHTGTIDHTPVYPREVVKRALNVNASAVVMAHNHPSNMSKPSSGDITMTKRVRDALNMVDILLHDHIIVTQSEYYSFRANGYLR